MVLRFKVGFENRLKFLNDKWCGDMPLIESFSELYSIAYSKNAWEGDL